MWIKYSKDCNHSRAVENNFQDFWDYEFDHSDPNKKRNCWQTWRKQQREIDRLEYEKQNLNNALNRLVEAIESYKESFSYAGPRDNEAKELESTLKSSKQLI